MFFPNKIKIWILSSENKDVPIKESTTFSMQYKAERHFFPYQSLYCSSIFLCPTLFFPLIVALFLDLLRCVRKFKWRTLCDDWRETKKSVTLEFRLLLKFTADATLLWSAHGNVVDECCFWNGAACAQTFNNNNNSSRKKSEDSYQTMRWFLQKPMQQVYIVCGASACMCAVDTVELSLTRAHYPNTMRTTNHVMDVCLWLDFSPFVSDCFCNCCYCCYHHRLLWWWVLLLLWLSLCVCVCLCFHVCLLFLLSI